MDGDTHVVTSRPGMERRHKRPWKNQRVPPASVTAQPAARSSTPVTFEAAPVQAAAPVTWYAAASVQRDASVTVQPAAAPMTYRYAAAPAYNVQRAVPKSVPESPAVGSSSASSSTVVRAAPTYGLTQVGAKKSKKRCRTPAAWAERDLKKKKHQVAMKNRDS